MADNTHIGIIAVEDFGKRMYFYQGWNMFVRATVGYSRTIRPSTDRYATRVF